MNEKDPPQVSEQQAQIKAEKARLASAFVVVFGSPTSRSQEQRLCLDYLFKDAEEDQNAFDFRSRLTDGFAIALDAAKKDGAQSRLRIINRQVRLAETEESQVKKTPNKVKR